MSRVETKLSRWAGQARRDMRKYFKISKPYFEKNSQDEPDLRWVLTQLAVSCQLTSESSLILIGSNRLWDAEILIRSVLEGTLKFIFLCTGDEKELAARKNEYWEELPKIKALKRHQHICAFLATADDSSAKTWEILKELLLKEEDLEAINREFSFKAKQQLQQKWSFSEMVKTLANSEIMGYDSLMRLYFGYGMGSHLIHQDAEAVGLIWERSQSEPRRREALELAHGARGIRDLLTLAMVRALMIFKINQADPQPVIDLFQSQQRLRNELEKTQEEWWQIESQY